MLIALDVGNSHVKIGGFDGDGLLLTASIATDDRKTGEQYACELQSVLALLHAGQAKVDGAVLGSVVPAMTPILQRALGLLSGCPVLSVSSGVKTGLNIKLEEPRAIGSDLVANAVWAAERGRTPCVVVDLGTVTTFTAMSREGAFVGKAIAAGPRGMLASLRRDAAQLPSVQLEAPRHGVCGRNTVEAMKAGVLYGAAAMVDGMLARYEEALGGPLDVLLTGGSAPAVAPYLKTKAELDPHVTLRGLHLLWKKNRG